MYQVWEYITVQPIPSPPQHAYPHHQEEQSGHNHQRPAHFPKGFSVHQSMRRRISPTSRIAKIHVQIRKSEVITWALGDTILLV